MKQLYGYSPRTLCMYVLCALGALNVHYYAAHLHYTYCKRNMLFFIMYNDSTMCKTLEMTTTFVEAWTRRGIATLVMGKATM
jgi:hypothetical protein